MTIEIFVQSPELTNVPDRALTEATLALVNERVRMQDGCVIVGAHRHGAPVETNYRMHGDLCRRVHAMGLGCLRIRALFESAAEVYLALAPRMRPATAIRLAAVRFAQDFVVITDDRGVHLRWWDGRLEHIADALTTETVAAVVGRFGAPGHAFRAVEYLPGGMFDGFGWLYRLRRAGEGADHA